MLCYIRGFVGLDGGTMETLKRIAAFLLRRELVWLLDHDGTVASALARRTPFGMECYHPQTKRRCLLFPDGSLKGPSYVDEWKPYNHFVNRRRSRPSEGA